MDLKTLKKIEDFTNEVLEEASKQKTRFTNESINWGDLGVVLVEYVSINSDGAGDYYIVHIEEAAPDAYELQAFLIERLYELGGYDDVEVITAW